MGIVIVVTRLLLLYLDDIKPVDETRDLRWRSGEIDDRRVKIIHITGQHVGAVTLRIEGNEERLDLLSLCAKAVQDLRQQCQFHRAHIRAPGITKLNH